VGTGTIGAGWAALFLAHGIQVVATDPHPAARERLGESIQRAWPHLATLGVAADADPDRWRFTDSVADAVADADFVQESAPDDEALKIGLIQEIDSHCRPEVVIASSSSTFLPSRLGSACQFPARVTVGHPFVPVTLIPLVEVVGGADVEPNALEWLAAFYEGLGKTTITLQREIEGYVANRLQRVLFKEACDLVEQGVCEWRDVETAVTRGPGFRWAVLGPVLHRHLGGGAGGVRHMIEHFGWPGRPGTDAAFIDAIEAKWGHLSMQDLENWRDRNLVAMLRELRPEAGETGEGRN